jgi:DNA-binding response OmpR family regulator
MNKVYKVIVVDDDITTGKVVSMALERYNFIVDCFYEPSEAIPIVNEKEFDLLILDLFMPKISGFEFLESMKNSKSK